MYVANVGFINEFQFHGPFDSRKAGVAWANAQAEQGLPISIQPLQAVKTAEIPMTKGVKS